MREKPGILFAYIFGNQKAFLHFDRATLACPTRMATLRNRPTASMTGKKPSRLLPSSVQVHTSSGPWQQRGDCTCDLLEPKLSALSFSQKGMSLMTFAVRREGKDKAEGNVKEGIVGGTGSLWYP